MEIETGRRTRGPYLNTPGELVDGSLMVRGVHIVLVSSYLVRRRMTVLVWFCIEVTNGRERERERVMGSGLKNYERRYSSEMWGVVVE